MSSRLHSRFLEVWLHARHAGWLCQIDGVTRFVAAEEFLFDKDRPTLSISMTVPGMERFTQSILGNQFNPAIYRERGEMPPFFAGLLPEGMLRRRLAATRRTTHDMDDFGVLAAGGIDLPGAVTIMPAKLDTLSPAVKACGALGGDGGLAFFTPEGAVIGAASLAGMQNKLTLSRAKNRQRYRVPAKGKLSDTVAKLPLPGNDAVVMNEYACMQLAALAGVNVAHCQLRPVGMMTDLPELVDELGAESRFLAVDRFDRTTDGPLHIEDACQLMTLMPQQKYSASEKIVGVYSLLNRMSMRGIEDVRQLLIRQVVNTLLGNSDAHLKNLSVWYPDRRNPQLAPAYDIVCVTALPAFRGLAVNREIDRQQRAETADDYATLAQRAGISQRIAKTTVKQTISLATSLWPDALREIDVPSPVRNSILERLKNLPLAVGR